MKTTDYVQNKRLFAEMIYLSLSTHARETNILDVLYLIDAQTDGDAVKLRVYDGPSERMRDIRDDQYKPYFLTQYPLSKEDQYAVERIVGQVSTLQKKDLFTEETKTFTKIEIKNPANLDKSSKMFEKTWESQIEFSRDYIYDHGLVFGSQHRLQQNRLVPVSNIPEEQRRRFGDTFADVQKSDPGKYTMLEYWFHLVNQPIPHIQPELLGMSKKITPEKYYQTFMLARIANLPLPEASSSKHVSAWIKSIIYTYLRRNNILVPSSKELRRETELKKSVPGALTIAPKSGTYFNTVVTDFESLYPSCIDSYNLSYETIDCTHKDCQRNTIPEVDHHICTERRGFYAILVGALKDLRIHWFKPRSKQQSALSKEERHLAATAAKLLKLITVSSYGVTIRIHGLASTPLAESITGYGRYALQTTWNLAEEKNLHPIYGDTDSIFLDAPPEEGVRWLIRTVKKRLRLDLAVEKRYPLCVLSEAKKAYFGILEDGTPDIKGLTVIKSNAPTFIQQVFRDSVKKLRHVKDETTYEEAKKGMVRIVHDAIEDLKRRKINLEDLQFSVRLYFDPVKKLESGETLPQPYQCAVQLIDAGKEVSRRDPVSFVKVKPFTYRGRRFTVKPTDQVKNLSEINVEDYIRNLKTALAQTFSPMDITFEADRNMKIDKWFDAGN